MIIREATGADSKWILHHRMCMFEAMGESEDFLKETESLTKQYINDDWTNDYRYFIVEEESLVVGGCGLSTFRIPPQASQEKGIYGYVSNMFIEPDFRRRGLGRALLKYVIQECKKEGIGLLLLHASKEGFPLYSLEGFQSVPGLMHLVILK